MARTIGYKGFDKDFKCRGMQYEVGKTFTAEKAVICEEGLHFCEIPLDVFRYYAPADSRYAVVSTDAEVVSDNDDSKKCTTSLRVDEEISLDELVQAHVDFVQNHVGADISATNTEVRSAATNTGDWSAATNTGDRSAATNTGNWSAATNTGDRSAATNTGDCSAATNTGDRSAATVTGEESVAIAVGIDSFAKGNIGSWLVIAEWNQDERGEWHRVDVQSFLVDGGKIKADTFYTLKDGQPAEK